MVMRATAMVRTNSIGSSAGASASGVPATRTSMLIGTDFGMRRQARQRRDHADAILAALAHADDAAAADIDARMAHVRERLEPVLIDARGDDLAVKFRRGVEVVVVIVETGFLEPLRLRRRQHAERDAGFEAQRLDAFDHGADLIEIAVLRRTPGRAHAEPAGAGSLRGTRFGQHGVERHQLFRAHAGHRTLRFADNRRSPPGSRRS